MSQSLDQHLDAFRITMSIWTHRSWLRLLGPSLPSNDRQDLDSLSGAELISLPPYLIEDSVSPSHLGSPAEGRQTRVSTFHRLPGHDWEILIETKTSPTSNSLAFPFSSASRSLSRICSCALSLSKVLIRRLCWVLFLRRLSTSKVRRPSCSCSSERKRWASDKSARVMLSSSAGVGPASLPRCFLETVINGDGIERWISPCDGAELVFVAVANKLVRSAS